MSRLTEQRQDMYGYYTPIDGVEGMACVQELGEIEDILYAHDGTERISIDELRDLISARSDGRVVVLPCKVGDTVWLALDRLDGKPTEIKQSRFVKYVRNISTEFVSCYIDCKEIGNTLEFALSDFGKTVFLTREEAEAALKGASK